MKQMSRRERLQAAINRQPTDRVPFAVWRHFPAVDRSPAGLAQSTLRFHDHYGSDFLKITPRGGYAVEAWGCVESEQVLATGNRPCASCAVKHADDWKRIRALDPASASGWAEEIETIIRLGFDRRIGDAPVLPTLFSPLSLARKLSGDRLGRDLREHPDAVRGALEAITDTLIKFADLALREGVSGIFYSIQTASRSLLDEEQYARFGEPYDRRVLGEIHPRSFLTVVHCHGDALMFERLAGLPGHVWNWDDRAAGPALADVRRIVRGAMCGGLDQAGTLRHGTPEAAVAEAREAVASAGGTGVIVAPGCVLLTGTPDATVAAVVTALGGPLKPIPGLKPDA
jgi:uroporphyrinogen decarboxylase